MSGFKDGGDAFKGSGDGFKSSSDGTWGKGFDSPAQYTPATPQGDEFREVTRTSWSSRVGNAFAGIIVGLLLIPATVAGLFWNEGRAVQTARSLAEGGAAVQSVAPDRVDPALNGRLIHITGALTPTGTPPRDPDYGVTGGGTPGSVVRIIRTVEMFQWREESRSETRTNVGGSQETVTTYRYTPVWAENRIESANFRQRAGHENPPLRVPSRTIVADGATVGAFRLTQDQLRGWGEPVAYPLDAAAGAQRNLQVVDGRIHIGNPAAPQIGDLRIGFQVVRAGDASIVGRQDGQGFAAYQTRAGDQLLMIESGRRTAPEMFRAAEEANTVLTWIIRAVGLVLMWVGFAMILNPLRVIADVIPLLGRIVGAGTGLVGLFLTLLVGPTTIAIAWLFYRPLIGGAVLAAGVGLAVLVFRAARRRAAARAAAMPPPGYGPAPAYPGGYDPNAQMPPQGWDQPQPPPGWQPPRR